MIILFAIGLWHVHKYVYILNNIINHYKLFLFFKITKCLQKIYTANRSTFLTHSQLLSVEESSQSTKNIELKLKIVSPEKTALCFGIPVELGIALRVCCRDDLIIKHIPPNSKHPGPVVQWLIQLLNGIYLLDKDLSTHYF